ncbi:MAG: hypothetical protein F4Z04_05150 [Acidobacteria bacterium]|nr:hypothetical protein [Acidobacteriota bacterium]MYD72231.1 hypothetical protein [Acidobacteriota bacterium]
MPGPADRLKLAERVAATLGAARARFALIGAAAMAVHGVARSTQDVDLLTLSDVSLDGAAWEPLAEGGVDVSVTRGDADDPLAGVVRFRQEGQDQVDLIVGRYRWQQRLLERAEPAVVGGAITLPTAQPRDLVLLKLFAGGPHDLWDIEQLLVGADSETLVSAVSDDVSQLPARCRRQWDRLLRERSDDAGGDAGAP